MTVTWTTEYKADENKMIHDFGKGFQIFVHLHSGNAYKVKDGLNLGCISMAGMPLEDCTKILTDFAKAVEQF